MRQPLFNDTPPTFDAGEIAIIVSVVVLAIMLLSSFRERNKP